MAKAQSKKKITKKSAKKRTKKSEPLVLDSDERRKLLKPRESFDELTEQVLRVWSEQRSFKVPDMTPARLRSLLSKAEKAAARESTLRTRFEQKLRPLADARLLAEDAAWRAILDLHAATKLYGRSRPEIPQAFAFLADALTSRSSPTPAPVSET